MKYKRKKATFGILAPNIQRGGMAIPLGNNLYWMKGRKHKTGGIDIGKDLEVENNEVMQMLPNETRVFSSVKMLGGNSPAELVASGMNPNMVFNAQEDYKRINRIRDDGSKYKEGGSKYDQWKEEHPTLDTITDFIPIVSTVKDGIELYREPSWSNAGWFALDLASDILTAGAGKALVGAVKGAGKLTKAVSKGSKVSKRTQRLIDATTSKNVNLGDLIEGGEQVEKLGKKAGLVSGDLWQNYMQKAIQEKEANKKSNKYGGKMNLQNIDNPLARNNKRMISPNKLGTIVRVDGNGRDRLADTSFTGSSKQDMKCGGRVKAPFGSSLSRLNSMLSGIDMNALSDAWDKVEEMEDEKYNNVKSNMIQLDDGTFIKESLPEVDVSPKRDLFRFPTLNITSAPTTELRRPDFSIGNPIIPDDIKDKIKGLGDYNDYHWIKSGTDLLTTGLSTFNNLYYLNRMKEPPRPAVNPGVKLKTKWNNNATLSAIRESLGNTITDLVRNTASSQNLRNSINQARINALELINKSNEDREKNETELINADLKQRATTIKDNVDNYNTWRNSLAAFRNNIFDKRSETWNNMMSNVNKVVNEAIENREQRDAERRQFDFLSYGYPIVRNNPAIANYLYDILFGKNNINVKSR